MEHRDVADLFQFAFDVIAFGRGNIFQIDTCKAGLQETYCFNNFGRIFGVDTDRYSVYIAKGFKERGLAFHDRHSCFRANIAQTKYTRTVTDDSDHIAAASIFKGHIFIFFDFFTWFSNTRSVCQGQIFAGFNGNLAHNGKFTMIFQMES